MGKQLSALVVIILLASPFTTRAEDSGEQAKAAFSEGVGHFNEGRYEEAMKAFKWAYALHPTWKLHFNIGQCEAALKRYGAALVSFENYLLDGGDDVPNDRHEEVRSEISRLRDLVADLEIAGPEGAKVLVDGTERGTLPLLGNLRVAAGDRTVTVVKGDVVLMSRKIRLATRGQMKIEVADAAPAATEAAQPEPAPEPEPAEPSEEPASDEKGSPLIVAGWVTAGIGAAVAIGGAIAGGIALSKEGELTDACAGNVCTDPDDQDVKDSAASAALAADILIPTGSVIAAVGVIVAIVGHKKKGEEKSARLGVVPVAGGGMTGLLLEGRF